MGGTMKPYTENTLKGKVVEIKRGLNMTRVLMDIGGDIFTAIVTDEAFKELDAKVGDEIEIFKDTADTVSRILH